MQISISPCEPAAGNAHFESHSPGCYESAFGALELSLRPNVEPVARVRYKGGPEADQELIDCLLAGNQAASRRFVHRFEKLIYRQLYELSVPREDHADLFQEVFLRLWEKDCRRLRRWQGGEGNLLSSYLRVVVRRLIYDALRTRAASIPVVEIAPEWDETAVDPERLLLSKEKQAAILCVLEDLSARDAELLRRRHYRAESYREIAAGMSMTVNHVGVALARAEQRLKAGLCTRYSDLFETP